MIRKVLLFIVVLLILENHSMRAQPAADPVDLVNPMVGTTKAGNTFPAVGVPFGMTQWTPQTVPPTYSVPYRYFDPMIQGFRGSHWLSGSATQDYGSMTIMATTGSLHVRPQERASDFDHEKEEAHPDYYRVKLLDYHISAELTGTTRAGFMRFTFPKANSANIIVDSNAAYQSTANPAEGDGYIKINAHENEIVGYNPAYRKYQGHGTPAGIKGYFVVQFNRPIKTFGTWNEGTTPVKGRVEADDRPGAFVQFQTRDGEEVVVKIGTSFTSIEEARKNLEQEIPDWNFDGVRQAARKKWNDQLAKIKVDGGTREQQKNFYTSLYHASLLPRVFNDADGSYVGFGSDENIYHVKNRQQYADYSLWDTFRAVHPLYTIIEPERTADMVQSLVTKGEQGGYLPIFPAWNNYTSEMIGDHAVTVIVDAYQKGIRDFDVDSAYDLIIKNAMQTPENHKAYVDGKGRRALSSYKKFGYIPLEDSVRDAYHQGEQVSRTLEYAYDDWVAAQMAVVLGHKEDYDALMKRAHNYENVFDPSVGYMRGRHEDGSWTDDFRPTGGGFHYITEGSPLQYTWFVPQDVQGLINLMGGRDKFNSRLEKSFENGSVMHPAFRHNDHYWHGNEPGHQTVYMFAYAGAPWRTQQWVREIMSRSYQALAGGLSGNDDAGQMSAWYIFSAMGFYPVCPGQPAYVLGSPIFDEVTVDVGEGRTFRVKAVHNSRQNKYIQSATLNGEPLNKSWITHQAIVDGGILVLKMGPNPNKKWASSPHDVPPSMTK